MRLLVHRWPYLGLLILTFPNLVTAQEFSGYVALDARLFPHEASYPAQGGDDFSLIAEPEFYYTWNNDRDSITFTPFGRVNSVDEKRTHTDIRELFWLHANNSWEIRLGVDKVFWGVTESRHLVDIVNQIDLVENIDGEDKLGQPMANLSLINNWGTIDLFVLPYFRERTFPGVKGRLRTEPVVDTGLTSYQSPDGQSHTDYAIRWSHAIGNFDIGLSHFSGTSRAPLLLPATNSSGAPVLAPFYPLIDQTGLDLQATLEQWLLKLEATYQSSKNEKSFAAGVAGFEYTFVGVAKSTGDLGVLFEYLYDERGKQATTSFENDIFFGFRFTLNDAQSTELLAGAVIDLDGDATLFNIEASRRLDDHWKLELETRIFHNISPEDFQYSMRNDDYLQITLLRYF